MVSCEWLCDSFSFYMISLNDFIYSIQLSSYFHFVGGAGVSAAFAYAGLTGVGVSPMQSILIMLVVPFLMAFGYGMLVIRITSLFL